MRRPRIRSHRSVVEAEDGVVRTHALAHLHAHFVARAGRFDRRVVALEALDALIEVGRVSAHVDRVADPQRAVERDDTGAGVLVVVRHRADAVRLGRRDCPRR